MIPVWIVLDCVTPKITNSNVAPNPNIREDHWPIALELCHWAAEPTHH